MKTKLFSAKLQFLMIRFISLTMWLSCFQINWKPEMIRCYMCVCVSTTGKISNQVLAKCDSCFTFPCKNGATCRPTTERDYECLCAPGYHGKLCESAIDACYGNPCRNGATCKVLEEGRFRWLFLSLFISSFLKYGFSQTIQTNYSFRFHPLPLKKTNILTHFDLNNSFLTHLDPVTKIWTSNIQNFDTFWP